MKKQIRNLLITVTLAVGLTSCAAVVVGTAAVGGLSVADRRTTGAQMDDQMMELQIQSQAMQYFDKNATPGAFRPNVTVVSYNRHVLLLGMVADENQRRIVGQIARAQEPVRQVYNYITPAAGRNVQDATRDSWITSKVRTAMLAPKGYAPNHVKVVTYNGITYVMGILTPEEQAAVTHHISTIAGVIKVVTLYQTLNPNAPEKTSDTQAVPQRS